MFDKIYNTVEAVFAWINRVSQKNSYNYCELESADDVETLISKDGSLISIIEITGINQMISHKEYSALCEQIAQVFSPLLRKKGITIKCSFRYDAAKTTQQIDTLLSPSKKTADRLNLKLSDYFQAQQDTLNKVCSYESCLISIWTSPNVLSNQELKNAYKTKANQFKQASLKISPKSQHFLHVINEIRLQHKATVTMLCESFSSLGIHAKPLAVSNALRSIKQEISPDSTSSHWKASLPGEKLYIKDNDEWSSWLWPSLAYQLFNEQSHNDNMSSCVIGNYRYASATISLFPQHIKPFYHVFRLLKEYNIPWQVSFSLADNGLNIGKSKALLAQFLTFSSHENKLICNASELLQSISNNTDMPIIRLSINFITWSCKSDTALHEQRKAMLNKAIQSWGSTQTTTNFGDPFAITIRTFAGISSKPFPCAVGAPLLEAIKLMPFFRPAPSWENGATLFRTPDGKIWPYQSGSSQQISWVELIYARSGAGKSVLLNTLNLSACLSSGLESLPYLAILDIGPSSKGLIELIKEVSNNQNTAEHYQFTFSEKEAINPFDTHLGARFPGHLHRAYLINFLSILLVESIDAYMPEGMEAMLGMIIDELYINLADSGQPKKYQKGLNAEIDTYLHTEHEKSTFSHWWQITDFLFHHNQVTLAEKAQRYAMPVLSDLINAVNATPIKDLYQSLRMTNGENYIQYFCRNITTAIKNHPALNLPTQLEINARVVAFDLSSVMQGISKSDATLSVLVYMLVRHATASYFFLKGQDLDNLTSEYKQYHKNKLKVVQNTPKRIVFDEFHRTQSCKAIQQQVLIDMREGRKQNVQIALASQSLSDFSQTMQEFATSIFILSSGNQVALEKTQTHFGLSDTETSALKLNIHGPSSQGMNFLGQFHTNRGINTQILNLTLSSYQLWLFTTTAEDDYLKSLLIDKIGVLSSIQVLSQKFTQGSIKAYLEVQTKLYPEKSSRQITNDIAQELINTYFEQQGKGENHVK